MVYDCEGLKEPYWMTFQTDQNRWFAFRRADFCSWCVPGMKERLINRFINAPCFIRRVDENPPELKTNRQWSFLLLLQPNGVVRCFWEVSDTLPSVGVHGSRISHENAVIVMILELWAAMDFILCERIRYDSKLMCMAIMSGSCLVRVKRSWGEGSVWM